MRIKKTVQTAMVAGSVFGGWAMLIKTHARKEAVRELMKYDFAHRGLHDATHGVPENSLTAFRLAAERGYGIELDVHLSRDGKLIVMHDEKLTRMCLVEGRICEYSWNELQELRLLDTQERIPLLTEALELVAGRVPILIELKPYWHNISALCTALAKVVDSYQGPLCFESFDTRVLLWMKKNRPAWIRGQLSMFFRKNGEHLDIFSDFVLRNLLLNLVSSPDFIAYHFEDRKSLSLRLCKLLYQVPGFYWTIRRKEDEWMVRKDGGAIIFENYEPRIRRLEPLQETDSMEASADTVSQA